MSQICIFMPFSNVFLYQRSFKGAVIIVVTCVVSLFCLKYNENVKKVKTIYSGNPYMTGLLFRTF